MGNTCKGAAEAKVSSLTQGPEEGPSEDAMYFLCTQKGFILDINETVEKELLLSKKDLQQKFIGVIMSPLISFLHKRVFLKRLQTLTGLEHSRLLFKLKDMSSKRPL
jgi:hypothetical protein